ncbi:MAG: chloride channel protein [Metallibacterium sp.]
MHDERPPPATRHPVHGEHEPEPTPWRRRLVLWSGGILVGLIAVAFMKLTNLAYATFAEIIAGRAWAALLITPPSFVVIVWYITRHMPDARGGGIAEVIAAQDEQNHALSERLVSARMVLAKFLLTPLALLTGASIGNEGPSVQIGAGIMYTLGKRFGFDDPKAAARFILAGGGAGLAAAFNAPLAGVVFAIEELAGTFEHRLSGILIAAVLFAGVVSLGLLGNYSYFGNISASLPLGEGWMALLVVGILGGLAGGLFARLILLDLGPLHHFSALRARYPVWIAGIAGLALVGLGLASHGSVYGTGYDQARALLQGAPHNPGESFGVFKYLANVLNVWSGVPGGSLSPALAVGTGLGYNVAHWFPHVAPGAIMLLGMAAYLSGVAQTPLTAAVICLEITPSQNLALPILAAALLGRASSALICRTPMYNVFAARLMREYENQRAQDAAPAVAPKSAP